MLSYIDLFSGCGGLSLGLHNTKQWKGLFAIEKDKMAFSTLKYNLIDKNDHFEWPIWLPITNHDINDVIETFKGELKKLRGKVDMVAGGPPCQGFSTAGLRREGDVRNGLIRSYLQFIMLVRPKIILFENVRGFTLGFKENKTKGIAYSEYVLRVLKWFGYDVESRMVDFSEFGVPQKRVRFILVGLRKDAGYKISAKAFFSQLKLNREGFLESKGLSIRNDLNQAISDLLTKHGKVDSPDSKNFKAGLYGPINSNYQRYLRKGSILKIPDSHRFVNHRPITLKKLNYILTKGEKNKIISKELKQELETNKHTIIRLDGKSLSPTLTTLPDDYVHYSEPRVLTVREYARIQSFPDWYEIKGKYTTGNKDRVNEVPRYSQIGNAIPPLFGEQAGIIIKNIIIENGRKEERITL
jgi:DNA (cytosine-5)-methyltransferase 1